MNTLEKASKNLSSNFILGTAQLGMKYGVANKVGVPKPEQVESIISTCIEHGINRFDTAPAYGGSEELLGSIFSNLGVSDKVFIITKAIAGDANQSSLKKSVELSISRLKIPKINTLLFHNENIINSWHLLEKDIEFILSSGLVDAIGVSVYTTQMAHKALTIPLIKAIQFPGNILDRRFANQEFLNKARDKGVDLMVRSVFLQGLLCMVEDEIPDALSLSKPFINRIRGIAKDIDIEVQVLLLGYVKWKWNNAGIIIGVDSLMQLKENIRFINTEIDDSHFLEIERMICESDVDEIIIRPDKWGHK